MVLLHRQRIEFYLPSVLDLFTNKSSASYFKGSFFQIPRDITTVSYAFTSDKIIVLNFVSFN